MKVHACTPSFLGGYWDQTCTAEGMNTGEELVGKGGVSRSRMGKNKEWSHNTLYMPEIVKNVSESEDLPRIIE